MFNTVMLLASQAQAGTSNAGLITFMIYTGVVYTLALLSTRVLKKKSFLSEYFLGSRGLGVWAFALTFAVTNTSGGTFMGFPSLIYTHGWVLSLWIAGYMITPILAMGLLAKRLNQLARKTESITIPDVLRNRFESVWFGLLAMLLIIFFMSFSLVAQFKAGALMLTTLLNNVPLFQTSRQLLSGIIEGLPLVGTVEPGYLLCLMLFALLVVSYTSYGGFRAVAWTNVFQGFVMGIGVLIMLPMAIYQVGGLGHATDELAKMTPPLMRTVHLQTTEPLEQDFIIPFGTWLEQAAEKDEPRRVFRTSKQVVIRTDMTQATFFEDDKEQAEIPVLEITTPDELDRIQVPSLTVPVGITVVDSKDYKYGAERPGVYVTGPGPSRSDDAGFCPLGLAVSFFFLWTFCAAAVPSNMVQLMSFKNSLTLKRAIFTMAIYYTMIYFPLVVIFCCARVLLPGMEIESDRIMPAIAQHLSNAAGWPWLGGILVAAPFAAVMSTVNSFLLLISSALVNDLYKRNINPHASETKTRIMTYAGTATVGIAILLCALNPPRHLQDLIIYMGSGLGSCFLAPVALAVYWPRLNTAGAIAGMLGGFLTHLSLYVAGFFVYGGFRAVRIGNFDPLLPALACSFIVAITVAFLTPPPPQRIVRKFFCA